MVTVLFHQKNLKFGNRNTVVGLKIIKRTFFLFAWLFSLQCFAELTINDDFKYLNQLRHNADLIPFSWNSNLASAAQNHANYLTLNEQHGHHEQQGRSHFSGEWASDRALAALYPNQMVSENVTSKSGDNQFYNPVDSLMSAIYHRFGFLDLINNEIGIGHQTGSLNSYVYVMGNTKLTDLCALPEFDKNGAYNYKICAQSSKRIDKRLIDARKTESLRSNPKIVVWPTDQAIDISPVFFQESPDPLPHYGVSGYPVSIQFNPAFFNQAPNVTAFSLRKASDSKNVKVITILDKENDPNHLLSSFQHALFPTQRLEWNTRYIASLQYIKRNDKTLHELSWSFKTKGFKAPIITITESLDNIKVESQHRYILYFPPRHAQDTQAALKYREQSMDIKLNYIDNNTLSAYISHKGKAFITFHGKTIELTTD